MFGRQPKRHNTTAARATAKPSKLKDAKQPPASESSSGSPDAPPKYRALALGDEYSQLLRTNLSPSDAQREDIWVLRGALAAQAISFDQMAASKSEEIANLELAISKCRAEALECAQQAALARRNEACAASLLAPIRVLPPEIMGEIFLACLNSRIFARPSDAPLLLCRVCSAWREIARSTPALWSNLTISKPMDPNSIDQLTTRWFELAGDLPLSLGFLQRIYRPFNGSRPVVWGRISRLDIDSIPPADAMYVMRAIGSASSVIEHLCLRFAFLGLEMTELMGLIPSFPKIRRLTIAERVVEGVRPPYVQNMSGMVWSSLTHLSLSELPLEPILWRSSFRNCLSLQHGLFMLYEGNTAGEESPPVPVSLPTLLSLKIVYKHRGDWSILKGFSFPSLYSLTLASLEGLGAWNVSALMGIQVHSLEMLTLSKVKVMPSELIEFLCCTPALKSFLADIPFDYTSLLERLSVLGMQSEDETQQEKEPIEILLPKLSKLSTYHWRSAHKQIDLDVKAFRGMINSRWSPSSLRATAPPGRCLTSVSIQTSQSNPKIETLKNSLASLRKEGLALHIGVSREGYQVKMKSDW